MDFPALVKVLTADDLDAAFEPASEEFDADHVNVAMAIDGFAEPLTLQITQIEVEPDNESEFVQTPRRVAQKFKVIRVNICTGPSISLISVRKPHFLTRIGLDTHRVRK